MGLRDDHRRFREIGEQNRSDLADFIKHGDLAPSGQNNIKIPIKIIELPEFVYDQYDMGGVAIGGDDTEEGDPIDMPVDEDGEGEGEGEPGDGEGDHGYYDMDPEEFAEELDEELGLDLDPKGKSVVEEREGAFNETANTGPKTLLDLEHLMKEGMRRKLTTDFDEDFLEEVLKIDGWSPRDAFEWAHSENIPVSLAWLDRRAAELSDDELDQYDSIEDVHEENEYKDATQQIRENGIESIPLQKDDEQYRHPETIKEREKNVVVVNIRDVSGSMGETKRELVERVFTPLDWYLTGKYDNAKFVYIAHDSSAWEVSQDDFFGIQSGGGTQISSAYELAQSILEERYPWSEWNRYVFCAGDGENYQDDSEYVTELMHEIPANLHAYLEVQPHGSGGFGWADHADTVEEECKDLDNVAVSRVAEADDVVDAITTILVTED